jgi:hypothetical protein
MALIVEDGTGVTGANSYVSLEDVNEYHAARGNTAWADAASSPDEAREGAIVRATQYIDAKYRLRWPGTRKAGRSQRLEWPRSDATDIYGEVIADDSVPQEVADATAEAALREVTAPGSLMPDYVASEKVISETIGKLSVTYSDKLISSGANSVLPVISIIDGILAPILGEQQLWLFGTARRGN